jgi:hypothetical protein
MRRIDITVLAIPGFVGAIAAEHWAASAPGAPRHVPAW